MKTSRGGRPRTFVRDHVLDACVGLFWRQGYRATSFSQISAATELGRQSLYNAFGDKRGIWLAALDHYIERRLPGLLEALEGEGEVRPVLLRFVRGQVRGERLGCMLLNAAVELGPTDDDVRQRTQSYMRRLRRAFERRTKERSAAEGLVSAFLGLHTMSRAGASERAMADAVSGALAASGAA